MVGMQATTDSRPIHRVDVDGFWMDTTEVTNEQFARFVNATGLHHRGGAETEGRRISRRTAGELDGRVPWCSRRPTTRCR